MTASAPCITVIGSINMDLVVRCGKLPLPGETIIAHSSFEVCGGKGANQAVAAARAGGRVRMIGRVGDDAFADRLSGNLSNEGIDNTLVKSTTDCASGVAVVAVEHSGQNAIMVVSGSNGRISVEDIRAAREVIESSDIVLLQLEIPIEAVLEANSIAKSADVRVILDPAPAPIAWPDELLNVDLICPNESEAASLVELPVESIQDAEVAARALHNKGAKNVVVTIGDRGSLLFDGEQVHMIEPYPIDPVDTTAAGDAFAGALAVFWAESGNLIESVRLANAAGAIAASREGAQPGMPSRMDIETLWRSK